MSAGFPLSDEQKRLWGSGPPLPGAMAVIDLAGEVDGERLRAALAGLAERHEALRSRLVPVPGLKVPAQEIEDAGEVGWSVEDLSSLDPAEQACRIDEIAGSALGAGEESPRATLCRLGAERSALVLAVPAVFADAFSLALLAAELPALYAGRGTDQVALSEPIQFLDVAEWQRERAGSADEEALQGRVFHERRQGAGQAVVVPFLLPGVEGPAKPAVLGLPEAGRRLLEVAAEAGAEPRDLARAAWWKLWGRLSGRGNLQLAEETAGRVDDELATGVGPIGRFYALREEIDPEAGLAALAARLARAAAEAERWHLQGVPSAAQAGFAWRRGGSAEGDGVTFSLSRLQVAGVPAVTLTGLENGDGLALEILYDSGRVEEAEAAGLGRRLLALLGEEEAGEGERDRAEAGRGEALAVPDVRVHRLFERAAAETPAAPAVVAAGRTLTYAELDAAANRLARRLVALGVGPDVPVGLFLERRPELIVGLLAILKAGSACLPFDTSQPERRIALMLEEVPAPVVVTEESLAGRLPEGPAVLCLEREAEALAGEDSTALAADPPAESMAYVIFTSGSTGRPKGVAVEHRQLESYLAGILRRLDLPPGLAYASVSTIAADLGHTVLFPSLVTGGCLHLVAQEEAADADAMARYFAVHPVDVLKIVPTHLEALGLGNPEAAALLLPKRRLVLGGEATPRVLAEEIARVLPQVVPECRLFNHYGPTETTVGVLTFPVEGTLDPRTSTLPIGRPIPNAAVHVLDAKFRPSPTWEPGEVWIGGRQVSRGYLGRPDLTAERFLPDPLGETGSRLYRTGDLARRLPDGAIEFLGRRDHQVKVRGFRVELLEIRAALTSHPDIRDAVILLRRDAAGGDLLVAYYVSRQEIPGAELRALLGETLIEEVLPNLFVHLKKLPLTLNGKVNLAALPSIEEARQRAARVFVPPATDSEARVADIWSQVLSVPQISADADFFELGGHSLLATRIVARLREAFGIDLSLRVMFEAPTVRQLARQVDEALAAAPPPTAVEGARAPAAHGGVVPEVASFEDQLAALESMSDDEAAALLGGEPGDLR